MAGAKTRAERVARFVRGAARRPGGAFALLGAVSGT